MSKYEPLPQFLASQKGASIKLTFDRIEKILGFRLPKSAYEYEAWWSNNETGHSHARWIRVGWRTADVDLAGRSVVFEQVAGRVGASQPPASKVDPWGCMADTLTIMPTTDLTAPSGDEWNAERGAPLHE
jgi:hypothetical protein